MAKDMTKLIGESGNSFRVQDDGDATTSLILDGVTVTAAELTGLAGVLATADEINRAADLSTRIVTTTATTLAVTLASHDNKTVVVNTAATFTATLPAATGTGARIKIVVGATVTTGNFIVQVADATDTMDGNAYFITDNATNAANVIGFAATADDDTITMNGSTKGGIIGDIIELEDIATNRWLVRITGSATGTEVTPFSAAVA